MKKITALILFALSSSSFKAEAINSKKLEYGSGVVMLGAIGGCFATKLLIRHSLYNAAKTAVTRPGLFFDVYVKDLIRKRKISSEFLFDTGFTIISFYLAKKCYDMYNQIDANAAAENK